MKIRHALALIAIINCLLFSLFLSIPILAADISEYCKEQKESVIAKQVPNPKCCDCPKPKKSEERDRERDREDARDARDKGEANSAEDKDHTRSTRDHDEEARSARDKVPNPTAPTSTSGMPCCKCSKNIFEKAYGHTLGKIF
jgi:hypothetical protein